MNYTEALAETMLNKEFVSNYDRLTDSHLGSCLAAQRQGGLNHQIDVSTGRFEDEISKFNAFFFDIVWWRIAREATA